MAVEKLVSREPLFRTSTASAEDLVWRLRAGIAALPGLPVEPSSFRDSLLPQNGIAWGELPQQGDPPKLNHRHKEGARRHFSPRRRFSSSTPLAADSRARLAANSLFRLSAESGD